MVALVWSCVQKKKTIDCIHGGKLVRDHVLVLLMVAARAQRLNNTFIQASVREECELTIASTPTHRPSTIEMNSGIKEKRQLALSLQGRESQEVEREQYFQSN